MSTNPNDHPFDELLNLEEEYFKEGYEEGLRDGAEAGRVEGYAVGLRKGFDKFVEAGRLQGKAVVWANRIPKYQLRRQQQQEQGQQLQQADGILGPREIGSQRTEPAEGEDYDESGKGESVVAATRLRPIQSNARLERNLEMLYGLVEPGTLSTENDDESVNDFDSRMKGAHGKLRMVERAVGEGTTGATTAALPSPAGKNENIEDAAMIRSSAVEAGLRDI
ncbi:DUF1715-domain-containing protein [Nemania serpens]|nr:DUF1715-domain-containing protein [Nemania serpens]